MMNDLISRLSDLRSQYSCFSEGERDAYHTLSEAIEALQEQKTGKWIVWGGMDVPENHGRHKCSECGEFALLRYEKPLRKEILSDFCPNCGAKMEV